MAFIVAIVTAAFGSLFTWLLDLLGISFSISLLGTIVPLVIPAVVLSFADRFLKGLKVAGIPIRMEKV